MANMNGGGGGKDYRSLIKGALKNKINDKFTGKSEITSISVVDL